MVRLMLSRVAPEFPDEPIAARAADPGLSGKVAHVAECVARLARAGALVITGPTQQDRRVGVYGLACLDESDVARAKLVDGARGHADEKACQRDACGGVRHGSTTHVADSQAPYPHSGSRHVVPSSAGSCAQDPSTHRLTEQSDRKQSLSHRHGRSPAPAPDASALWPCPAHAPPPLALDSDVPTSMHAANRSPVAIAHMCKFFIRMPPAANYTEQARPVNAVRRFLSVI